MKKGIIAAILLIAVILSGCASSDKSSINDELNSKGGGYAYDGAPINEMSDAGFANSPSYTSYESEKQDVSAPAQVEKKIIKTASMNLIAEDVNAAYEAFITFLSDNSGYVFSHDSYKNGDYTVINATLKLPPDKLDALMDFSGTLGEVINTSVKSEDITDSYYDAQIRLETLRKSLEKYYEFLEQTTTVEDMLAVQAEINRLTQEIEVFEGRMNMYNKLVDEATVSITINQKEDPLRPSREIHWNTLGFDDMLYLLKSGFLGTINIVVTVIQWVFVAIVAVSPVALVAGIFIFVAVRRGRKRKLLRQKAIEDAMAKEKENGGDI